jgi:hypothetical protein
MACSYWWPALIDDLWRGNCKTWPVVYAIATAIEKPGKPAAVVCEYPPSAGRRAQDLVLPRASKTEDIRR